MSNYWNHKQGLWKKSKPNDHRTEFEHDKTSLIHSFSFRRLQGKTQVVGLRDSDFHRTRLTHSVEVASIAKNIFLNLLDRYKDETGEQAKFLQDQHDKNDILTLLYTIGLAHDIGHPPFGHSGEVALNYMMREYGGFEGNGFGLSMLSDCEGEDGFNFSRRFLLGILKYPVNYEKLKRKDDTQTEPEKNRLISYEAWEPPKCYLDAQQDVVENFILKELSDNDKQRFTDFIPPSAYQHGKTKYKSFDCSIMDVADDIAYSIHDLEDAIFLKKISKGDLSDEEHKEKFDGFLKSEIKDYRRFEEFLNDLFSSHSKKRKKAIGALVHYAITNTRLISQNFEDDILNYNVRLDDDAKELVEVLKDLVMKKLIQSNEVQTIVYGGMLAIMRVFEALHSNPQRLLPERTQMSYKNAKNESDRNRIICNYIAGMTDDYLFKLHERLFSFNNHPTFEYL